MIGFVSLSLLVMTLIRSSVQSKKYVTNTGARDAARKWPWDLKWLQQVSDRDDRYFGSHTNKNMRVLGFSAHVLDITIRCRRVVILLRSQVHVEQ